MVKVKHVGFTKACELRIQLVSAATCITHSHRVQKQGQTPGRREAAQLKRQKLEQSRGVKLAQWKETGGAAQNNIKSAEARKKSEAQSR